MRESPRTRRLRTDHHALQRLCEESSILDFEATKARRNAPPENYLVRFRGRGLWREEGSGRILIREQHEVQIQLGASYPRMMPELAWKSPIFHPNISASGIVCLGGYGTHWVPSLNLDELCGMLWDMIRYQNYDVESPYNREAALWAKTQSDYRLPVDRRPLRDRIAGVAPSRAEAERPPIAAAPQKQAPSPEVLFLDEAEIVEAEIVEAEIVEAGDTDILFIDE